MMAASKLAVAALPDEVPAFFRDAAEAIAAEAIDPDLFREPTAMELTVGEAPEHFFDMEMLGGKPIPPNRYAFIALCAEMKINPKVRGDAALFGGGVDGEAHGRVCRAPAGAGGSRRAGQVPWCTRGSCLTTPPISASRCT